MIRVLLRLVPLLVLELLRLEECARRTGTTVRFWRRLIFERRVPYVKLGRFVRVDEADLETLLKASRVEAVSGAAQLRTTSARGKVIR